MSVAIWSLCCVNRKKLSHASRCFYNRYATLWNIKISSRYLQPTLKKTSTQSEKFKIIWFASSNMENWTRWSYIQVPYHVTNLYPSISINQAINVILQQLSEDYDNLQTRTKLTLVDIQQLIELCVSECYFLCNNVIWNLLISGQDHLMFQ